MSTVDSKNNYVIFYFMIETRKDIPPPANAGLGARTLYPWRTMAVGHSFTVPVEKKTSIGALYLRYHPRKFIGRTVTEKGKKTFRVWRTA